VDSVFSVERHSKRVLILKVVLDNGLLNVLTVYAPHSGKLEEEKESFWNEVFHLLSCIPQNEMVMLAGDVNGHVGSSSVGYEIVEKDCQAHKLNRKDAVDCNRWRKQIRDN